MQLIGDLAPKPISDLRILDLGCAEGVFGVEFARHGAEVVAVDGREAHIRHASFLAQAVGVAEHFEAIQADVRELDPDTLGTFDVVLCLGLIYHLDRADLLPFARLLRSLCGWGTVVQSRIALNPRQRFESENRTYFGHSYSEFAPASSDKEREALRLASLTNPESFWLTRPSLVNLLTDAGFSTVVEHVGPHSGTASEDWASLLAASGETVDVHSVPGASEHPAPRWDEFRRPPRREISTRRGWIRDRIRRSRLGSSLRRLRAR